MRPEDLAKAKAQINENLTAAPTEGHNHPLQDAYRCAQRPRGARHLHANRGQEVLSKFSKKALQDAYTSEFQSSGIVTEAEIREDLGDGAIERAGAHENVEEAAPNGVEPAVAEEGKGDQAGEHGARAGKLSLMSRKVVPASVTQELGQENIARAHRSGKSVAK